MSFSAPRNVMVIGLGGTGKWVLTYLKKSLIEASNDYLLKTSALDQTLGISRAYFDERYNAGVPEGIKLLAFDLDITTPQRPTIDGGAFSLDYDPLSSPEFASFNQEISASIQRIKDHSPVPQFGSWLESDDAYRMTVPRTMDETGAGLQRQYTRSCLLQSLADPYNLRKLPSLIDAAIADFQQRRIVNPNLATYFFIVGSLAGGTGAGCFLDVAQIVRHQYAAAGLPTTKIFGIFVLSQAFEKDLAGKDADMKKAQGNAFASMRELRRFMLLTDYGHPFDEFKGNFNPTPPMTDGYPPFDMCIFLDGTGYTINTEKASYGVFPAIADFLLTCCVEERVIDPANLLNAIQTTGAPYGTFGIHSIIYPVEDVIHTFAHQLSLELQEAFLSPMPSEFTMQAQVQDFFEQNQRYYGQNAPVNPTTQKSEFVIDDPAQTESLNLLKEVWRLNRMGTEGQSFELDYYRNTLNLPKRFRNTGNQDTDFEELSLSHQAENRWGMPWVNINLQTREEIDDTFEGHDDIVNNYAEKGQQVNVVSTVERLCDINLGTDRVSAWRKGSQDYKSHHGVMQYYFQKIEEIYDGYDAGGVHYPGLLENKLWVLLNEKRPERDAMDDRGNPIPNFYRTGNLREGTYCFRPAGIETALHFCDAVVEQVRQYKEKVDTAYTQHLTLYTGGLQQLENEVTDAQRDYEYGSWFLGIKGRKYFEKKSQWLQEERREIVHSYFLKIVDKLVQITLDWKATLENFKKNVESVRSDILQSRQNLRNLREEKKKIKVRTYLSEPGDAAEEALYAILMNERMESRIVNEIPVNVHRRDKFFESIYLETVSDATPGSKTGRKFIPDFLFDEHQPGTYTKEDVLQNALPYCDKVREQNFWKLIQEYRDDANVERYKASPGNHSPQLITDLVQKTRELVAYQRGQNLPHAEQDDTFCYADWQTGDPSTPDFLSQNTRTQLEPPNLPLRLNCTDVKTMGPGGTPRSLKGQGHKIVGLRTTNLLVQRSFAEYTAVAGEYRHQIRARIPKHIFLGEKYAALLEQEIMDRRHALKLDLADAEQFYLPLPLIFALDNRAAFDDFLWAGIFGKVLYGVDSAGNDHFYLQDSGGNPVFLTQGDPNAGRRSLEWALITFCSRRDTRFERLRSDTKTVAAQEKIHRKTSNRAGYKQFLQDRFDHPDLINQFVVLPGSCTGFRPVVAATERHARAVDFSELEALELILKVRLLGEHGGL